MIIYAGIENPIEDHWRKDALEALATVDPKGAWRQCNDLAELASYLDYLTGQEAEPPTAIDYKDWEFAFMSVDWPKLTPLPNGMTFSRWRKPLREMVERHATWVAEEPLRDPTLRSLVEAMSSMPDNEGIESDDNEVFTGYTECERIEPPEGQIVYTCSMLGSWKPRGSWTDKRPRVRYKGAWRSESGHKLNWPPSGWRNSK